MAYYPKWDDDDLSQPVFNPYSPLNAAPAPPRRPVSSTMPEVYYPPEPPANVFQYQPQQQQQQQQHIGLHFQPQQQPPQQQQHSPYSSYSTYPSHPHLDPPFQPHPPRQSLAEKEPLPAFSFPAAPAPAHTYPYSHAPEVAFHAAPPVVEEPLHSAYPSSWPAHSPAPPVSPASTPFFVGPGDLLVPARGGGTATPSSWDTGTGTNPDPDSELYPRTATATPSEKTPPPPQGNKPGWWTALPPRWRWAMAVGLALVVAALAAGVAVALTHKSPPDSGNDSASAATGDHGTTNGNNKTPTPTSTSPLRAAASFLAEPTATPGPGGVAVECPAANNTAWWSAVTGPSAASSAGALTTNATLVRLCDRTYLSPSSSSSSSSSNAIRNTTAASFEDCMAACVLWNAAWPASGWRSGVPEQECVAVSWGYAAKQGAADNYCWLVNAIDETAPGGAERESWESALVVAKDVVEGG